MMKKQINNWYKTKNLVHVDKALREREARGFVANFLKYPNYGFLPLIHYIKKTRK